MNLTVLGKYGPWPKAGGACSGYLLEAGGRRLLLDCGCGVLGKLQLYCGIEALDGIILTHLHSDHMGDMPVLRYALPYYFDRGMMKSKLKVFMPASPEALAESLFADGNLDVKTVSGGECFEFMGLDLSFYSVRHPVQCNAVKVRSEGKTAVYSGDLNTTPGFEQFAAGADLLLIDGCFLKAEWNENLPHLSASLAAGIAGQAGARRLVLTHMRPVADEAALLAEAAEAFPGALIAEDGMKYEI